MAVETFDGTAGVLPSPWVQRGPVNWNRNGSGKAVPASTGDFALDTHPDGLFGTAKIFTFGATTGGSDDYAGILCFFDAATDNFYSVEVQIGTGTVNINRFVSGGYAATMQGYTIPGGADQAVGDKLEVIPSVVSGDPRFEVYYTRQATGTRTHLGTYTDTTTASPPVAESFGIYAYAGAGAANAAAEEFDTGASSTSKSGSETFSLTEAAAVATTISASEALSLSESASTDVGTTSKATSEILTLGESASVEMQLAKSGSETFSLTETAESITDITFSEFTLVETAGLSTSQSKSDAFSLSENASIVQDGGVASGEAFALVEVGSVSSTMARSESLVLGEQAQVSFSAPPSTGGRRGGYRFLSRFSRR